ncbi:MAG: cell division protein ZapA, partial [Candidatus Eisenbacteria bacterium]|nr:cell division protein ZapA [Candidatus Eisenbacteria bacterium]
RNDKAVVHVQILGQQLAIRGEADQEYILGVAGYVDRKMREITDKLPVASLSKVAILASLNIADELFKERASRERDGVSLGDRTARLTAALDRLDQLLDEEA